MASVEFSLMPPSATRIILLLPLSRPALVNPTDWFGPKGAAMTKPFLSKTVLPIVKLPDSVRSTFFASCTVSVLSVSLATTPTLPVVKVLRSTASPLIVIFSPDLRLIVTLVLSPAKFIPWFRLLLSAPNCSWVAACPPV